MTRPTRRRIRAGFTITELVVSMTVLGVVLAGSTMTLLTIQRQYVAQRGASEARETARSLELVLTRLFRTARVNPKNIVPANVQMVVNPLNRPTWDNVELRGDFNPVDGQVKGNMENVLVQLTGNTVAIRWKSGGTIEPFAAPVSQLLFQFYRLDGTEIADGAVGTEEGVAAAQARRVKITIGVPVPKTSDIVVREIWLTLRN